MGVDSEMGRGASEASPGSTSTPSLPSPLKGEGAWRLTAAAVTEAEAALAAADATQAGARSRAEEFALEEVYSDRLADLYEAVRALLRTPAPNVAALAVKVCLVVDHEVATLERAAPCMAAVKADAMRILGQSGPLAQSGPAPLGPDRSPDRPHLPWRKTGPRLVIALRRLTGGKMKILKLLTIGAVAASVWLFSPAPAAAHGGGLNREGCHNDRRNGTYHCHRARSSGPAVRSPRRRARGHRRTRR